MVNKNMEYVSVSGKVLRGYVGEEGGRMEKKKSTKKERE
jgi:hypothetical protein